MYTAKQHWEIVRQVPDGLARNVREFMVIGDGGEGVLLVTEGGEGYWLGTMRFWKESKRAKNPTRIDVPNLASMAYGSNHILLLDKRGQIHAMGNNFYGQLGLGYVDEKTRFSPQLISIPHKFASVRCGNAYSLALTKDGRVWAWGLNRSGQVGVPSSTVSIPSPRQITELNSHRVVAVECGGNHSLALTYYGLVYTWGGNNWGQLGDGSKSSKHIPTQIITPSSFKRIAAGYNHTLLLTRTCEVYACGSNKNSQLSLVTSTEYSAILVKVAGLPPISHITSHFHAHLSIAMSINRGCFAWGCFGNISASAPHRFPPFYSTLDSVLSFYSSPRNTPCSVRVKGLACPKKTNSETQTELLTGPIRLVDRIAQMFDNPDSAPDVKFELGDKSILAHRSVLQISSTHFDRFFSDFSSSAHLNPPSTIPQSNPEPKITTIPIADHCYPTFHAYLHFLYSGTLQVPTEHLADLFELAHSHLESDLSELCLVRMRSTLSHENCCLFYQLTERHPLFEFQQELLHFIAKNILRVFPTTAYQSLDADLCRKLGVSIGNLPL